jgi:hypothetical protein
MTSASQPGYADEALLLFGDGRWLHGPEDEVFVPGTSSSSTGWPCASLLGQRPNLRASLIPPGYGMTPHAMRPPPPPSGAGWSA